MRLDRSHRRKGSKFCVFSQMSEQHEKECDWKGRNGEKDRSFVCAVRKTSQESVR
jgi:hypothetical protein